MTVTQKAIMAAAIFWIAGACGQDASTSLVEKYEKEISIDQRNSLMHFRLAEVYFHQHNYQSAANEFREALSGNLQPGWIEVWSRIGLGKIFDTTGQRERAINEYRLAKLTRDNTRGALDEAELFLGTEYPRESRR